MEKEILEEERRVSADLSSLERDVRDKENRVEELNRELRKANLQNFVRETSGSKVLIRSQIKNCNETLNLDMFSGVTGI